MEYLSKSIVYVNSANRVSGTSSNFVIDVSSQVRYPNNYDRIALLALSCPKSYYLINSTNDTFTINEVTGGLKTVTITNGNYSLSTMVTFLNTAINAVTSYTYVVTSSQSTGKITFTVSGATGNPVFDFSGSTSPYAILGFDQESYTMSANMLTSVNVVNFQLTNTIQLMCDMAERSLLATVIPNTSDYAMIQYNEFNPGFLSKICVRNNISSCKFWLLDGTNGNQLDLNGLDFNFKFVIYRENNFFKTQLIKMKLDESLRTFDEDPIDSNTELG